MKKFKSRILAALIVYFTGFATAIYGLAPVDQTLENKQENQKVFFNSFTKSDQFTNKCGQHLRKWSGLAEEAAQKAGNYIQLKMAADKFSNESITPNNGVESDGVQDNK